MPLDRRAAYTAGILARWLPEGMEPSEDLRSLAESAVDYLADAAALPRVPLGDAPQAATEIWARIRQRSQNGRESVQSAVTEEIATLTARVAAAEDEAARVRRAYDTQANIIEQTIARTLDYPPYPPDWHAAGDRAIGEHVPESLVAELCRRYTALTRELDGYLITASSGHPPQYGLGAWVRYLSTRNPRYVYHRTWDSDRKTWVYSITRLGYPTLTADEALLTATEPPARPVPTVLSVDVMDRALRVRIADLERHINSCSSCATCEAQHLKWAVVDLLDTLTGLYTEQMTAEVPRLVKVLFDALMASP